MSVALGDWINSHVNRYKDYSIGELSHNFFFRDPLRGTIISDSYFFSPADGVILYQKVVGPNERIVEVKGQNYTLNQLTEMDFKGNALVIGVFMTFYDVHINRVPLSGYLTYLSLAPIKSKNFPMLFTERGIFNGDMNYAYQNMDYLFHNQRTINTIYNSVLDYKYYVVQIADEDVDLILPFNQSGNYLTQCSRFSMIRWGSQCDLILPLTPELEFETLIPDHHHVEAGIDRLVKINKK